MGRTGVRAKANPSAQALEDLAERYDAWHDTESRRVLFDLELGALRPLLAGAAGPRRNHRNAQKDRAADVAEFLDAVERVVAGGSAIDPEVVRQLLARTHKADPLARLTPRENEVLGLMAEGHSNRSIAERLVVSSGAVEKHVSNIFMKLDLPADDERHQRRVMAVVRYLDS